jgi:hypothetical protein
MFTLQTVATRAKEFILGAVRGMSDDERRTLALTLIDKGYGWVVASNLHLFERLGWEVAKRLVAERKDRAGDVFRGLRAFGLDEHQTQLLITFAIEQGQAWALRAAIQELPLVAGHARTLIDHGYEAIVGEHLALFKGYGEQEFHADRLAWRRSYDLRRAPEHRYRKT